MNIYTFKLTKKHIVAAVLVVAALIALLILAVPGGEAEETGASCSLLTVQGGGHSFETMAGEKPACPTAAEAYAQAADFMKAVLTEENRR